MKQRIYLLFLLFFWVSISINAQNTDCCNILKQDSLFNYYFGILESGLPTSDVLVESRNLSLDPKGEAFINLISILSGKWPKNTNHFGTTKITRDEYQVWKDWYWRNRCKLNCSDIFKAFELLENKNTGSSIDEILEEKEDGFKFIEDSIIHKIDTIPCVK